MQSMTASSGKKPPNLMRVPQPLTELLRLPAGPVDLDELDTRATTGFPGDKKDAAALTSALAPELGELQERLFASGRVADPAARRIVVVLQGLDTSGKGGVIRHAIGMVDPQGVHIKAFKAPTKEELRHPFLWRVQRELPPPGIIGIFDRSHYEDVLIARVNGLVEDSVLRERYAAINEWEAELVESGIVLVKCFLHISADQQKSRLQARLDDPTKHWKYNPGDLETRAQVARLHRGLPGGSGELQHSTGPLVRSPVRSQVVPRLGGRPAPGRAPAGARAGVAGSRLRRRGGAAQGSDELTLDFPDHGGRTVGPDHQPGTAGTAR